MAGPVIQIHNQNLEDQPLLATQKTEQAYVLKPSHIPSLRG